MIDVRKSIRGLKVGDVIEIRYRISRHWDQHDEQHIGRWLRAEIIDCDVDTWPLARLVDGQLTEIRSFMTWRRVPGLESDRQAA